jgi:hypothetical protein
MSITADRLDTAAFPEAYADILIETLGITVTSYLSVKDALNHYRRLDDDEAAEVMQRIAEHEDAIRSDESPLADPAPYFRGPSGTRYAYSDIADRIRIEAPQTLGQHIFVQLEALGLLREFQDGTTPFGLPFTFADAAKHTPMPWAYEEETGRIYFADGDVEPTIAVVDLENSSPGQAKADGNLIAAAPKLLSACQMLLVRLEGSKALPKDGVYEFAIAAITDATAA